MSRGNNMAAHRIRKKRVVWKKNPGAVGQPPPSAIFIIQPNTDCDIRNVSGFATKKKIRVE
jgi:hypothetical protein